MDQSREIVNCGCGFTNLALGFVAVVVLLLLFEEGEGGVR